MRAPPSLTWALIRFFDYMYYYVRKKGKRDE